MKVYLVMQYDAYYYDENRDDIADGKLLAVCKNEGAAMEKAKAAARYMVDLHKKLHKDLFMCYTLKRVYVSDIDDYAKYEFAVIEVEVEE